MRILDLSPNGRFSHCRKNPGHANFIPAPKFSLSHLPSSLQSDLVLQYVKNCAARTVKLRTNYTSAQRPEGYPFYEVKSTKIPHNSSGWVCGVSFLGGPCKCRECTNEGASPKDRCWEVTVVTGCHCVYDTEEAKETEVMFFYDDEKSMDKIKILYGHEVEYSNPDEDRCAFGCLTHDLEFALEIERLRKERVDLWEGIRRKAPFDMEHSQCIIVSHPHGIAKRITVGKQIDIEKKDGASQPFYKYAADTCPGSAGAPVLVLPGQDCPDPGWLPIVLHHSGAAFDFYEYNFSGDRSALYV